MIPAARLKTSAVTTSEPPQSRNAARVRSVRERSSVKPSPATSRISAAGSNQEIWPPKLALKRRSSPVGPHIEPAAPDAADAPRLVAGQPAESVVAEDQIEKAVVLRAADVRPVRRRRELDDRDPPPRRDDHRPGRDGELRDPPSQRHRRRHEVDEPERRNHEERLEHLGQEREPDQCCREHEPLGLACLDRPDRRIGGDRSGAARAARPGCRTGTSGPRPA